MAGFGNVAGSLLKTAVLTVLGLVMIGAGATRAQNPVTINGPLEGPVVLSRDVEVRIGPNQDARVIMTLTRGRELNALGTPRGTAWTQVAIGGQPIGYVPADSLDPIYVLHSQRLTAPPAAPKPKEAPAKAADEGAPKAAGKGALVPRASQEAAGDFAQGLVVAVRDLKASEILDAKKRVTFTIPKGQVMGLLGLLDGKVELAVSGRGQVVADPAGVLGVAGSSPAPSPGGRLVAIGLGEYPRAEDGQRAWTDFVNGPGQQYKGRAPMVWPVFRGARVVYQVGIGPFAPGEVEGACAILTQGGHLCRLSQLETF